MLSIPGFIKRSCSFTPLTCSEQWPRVHVRLALVLGQSGYHRPTFPAADGLSGLASGCPASGHSGAANRFFYPPSKHLALSPTTAAMTASAAAYSTASGAAASPAAAGSPPVVDDGPATCAAGAAHAAAPAAASPDTPTLGTSYDKIISSDFLAPGPLPAGRRLYLIVLNYCLPSGLLHAWSLASFRICADGGCNRLHDELPAMLPPPSHRGEATAGGALDPSSTSTFTAPPARPPGSTSVVQGGWPHANGHGIESNGRVVTHGSGPGSEPQPHLHLHTSTEAAAPAATGPATFLNASALRAAHIPDLVLGDLDSLRPDVRQFYMGHGVPFLDLSHDQDTNDLTKAIQLVEERFIAADPEPREDKHQILVLGALGGRLDHTLANLNVLHMFPHLNIALWGDGNLVRLVRPGTSLITPDERFEGPTCGLIPLAGPVTGSSSGLVWDLADTPLRFGGVVSSSNNLAGGAVEVRCDGPLLWSVELRNEPQPDLEELRARTVAAQAVEATRGRVGAGVASSVPGV